MGWIYYNDNEPVSIKVAGGAKQAPELLALGTMLVL